MKYLRAKKMLIVLVVLAVLLVAVVPVAVAQWPFTDVPVGYWAYTAIRRIAYLNISGGCGTHVYCPEQNVTRAQMAGFLNNLTKAYTTQDEPYILNMDHRYVASGSAGEAPAIVGRSADGNGLEGYSYGTTNANNGVYGETNSTGTSRAGVTGINMGAGSGVYGGSAASHGVRGYGASGSGDYGGYFYGYGGVYGVGSSYTGGRFETSGASASALSATHLGTAWGNGVYAQTGNGYGVLASSGATYGFYTYDRIYAGDGCTGCTSMIIAQNDSDETLEPGDVVAVSGIADGPSEYYARPVLAVRRVDAASSQAVVGVVEGRYYSEQVTMKDERIETRDEEVADPEGGDGTVVLPVEEVITEEIVMENAHASTDPAAPGDRLTVVYRGIAQVKVDATAGAIQVGDLLASSEVAGHVMKAQALSEAGALPTGNIIGKALEPLADGQGLIWVLVDLQ